MKPKQIYALNTSARVETDKVAALVRAIDWAIAHDIKVLTYSDRAFSPDARKPCASFSRAPRPTRK